MKVDLSKAVLIVGGYGVVGSQIAQIFRQRHPHVPLVLAGRNPSQGEQLVKRLGNAEAVKLDVESDSPLATLKSLPAAVLSVVNDPYNHLLIDSARNGIAYVDIARWTERMREATVQASLEDLRAPLMLSSAWMAGVAVLLARAASKPFESVSNIDIDILFAMADKAGPNSAEYMDRMAIPFDITVSGKKQQRYPFSDAKKVTFPGGFTGKVYRFDVPDQMTLPVTTGAASVNGRIGFDDNFATASLAFMAKYGIMKLLDRPIFDGVRRSLMYNPGQGAAHEIVIEVEGIASSGQPNKEKVTVIDPQGQTHLTACGAVIQLERVLGLDGYPALLPGVHFPDQNENIDNALMLLRDNGVIVDGVPVDGRGEVTPMVINT